MMNQLLETTIKVKKGVSFTTNLFILCGMAAAWVVIGSTGLLAHPLRKSLTLLLLLIAFIIRSPAGEWGKKQLLVLLIGMAITLALLASPDQTINLSAVMVFFSLFLIDEGKRSESIGRLDLLVKAIFILIIYRVLLFTIPLVWYPAQLLARLLGGMAGFISGSALWPGPTFAGLDFLVLSLAYLALWWLHNRSLPIKRWLTLAGILLAGHLCSMVLISLLAQWFTWQLPLISAMVHLLYWLIILQGTFLRDDVGNTKKSTRLPSWLPVPLVLVAAWVLAMAASFYPAPRGLQGEKIVTWEKGFLNWEQAKHGEYGRLSQGMYGMLPQHIRTLGARLLISPDLSSKDLESARLLILIYPADPWPDGVRQRIWEFVKQGGSLLVLGEHTVQEKDGGCRFNDILAPTAMRVRFDSATFAVGGWLHSYLAMNHPAFMAVQDQRNEYGVVIGASVETKWPARPLLLGRWGWNDPGDAATEAMMGNGRYDAGEKLGDLVLAAEQPFGKGRIMVMGDTSGFTNGIMTSTYPFIYRLLSYLVHSRSPYQPLWRQLVILLMALLSVFVLGNHIPRRWLALPVILLGTCLTLNHRQVLKTDHLTPEGRLATPNNLAYLDTTHMEKMSQESWRPDGCMGLMLTLVRDNYLPLMLDDFDLGRLQQAGMLISICPTKPFSGRERKIIKEYIEGGGVFIITVGYEDHQPVEPLLQDFGFSMALPPAAGRNESLEPEPLGHFKSPYIMVDDVYQYVRFHAAWPIFCNDPEAQVIAYGGNDLPVIILRRIGKGKMVVVADSSFAHNINLELEDGSDFEGMRENANFWRWFITVLQDQPHWIPKPQAQQPAPEPEKQEGK
jgi:hypothetical protein